MKSLPPQNYGNYTLTSGMPIGLMQAVGHIYHTNGSGLLEISQLRLLVLIYIYDDLQYG